VTSPWRSMALRASRMDLSLPQRQASLFRLLRGGKGKPPAAADPNSRNRRQAEMSSRSSSAQPFDSVFPMRWQPWADRSYKDRLSNAWPGGLRASGGLGVTKRGVEGAAIGIVARSGKNRSIA
jgi:hypothetical protein